jgi:hypothetical protein
MGKLKANIASSVDGYVAGPNQSEDNPIGEGGDRLHEWLFPLAAFRESHGEEGDEIDLHLVPVVLGAGERLFEAVGELNLEQLRAVEAPGVAHLKYRVVK